MNDEFMTEWGIPDNISDEHVDAIINDSTPIFG